LDNIGNNGVDEDLKKILWRTSSLEVVMEDAAYGASIFATEAAHSSKIVSDLSAIVLKEFQAN